ncbi:MAG: hypothetical protein IPK19_24300 [Chloroflexi bacterium]|nr:hypothetical protein [Chloroflexota bacterium]
MTAAVRWVWHGIVRVVSFFLTPVWRASAWAWHTITAGVRWVWQGIVRLISAVVTPIRRASTWAWHTITAGVRWVWNGIVRLISAVVTPIWRASAWAWHTLTAGIRWVQQGLVRIFMAVRHMVAALLGSLARFRAGDLALRDGGDPLCMANGPAGGDRRARLAGGSHARYLGADQGAVGSGSSRHPRRVDENRHDTPGLPPAKSWRRSAPLAGRVKTQLRVLGQIWSDPFENYGRRLPGISAIPRRSFGACFRRNDKAGQVKQRVSNNAWWAGARRLSWSDDDPQPDRGAPQGALLLTVNVALRWMARRRSPWGGRRVLLQTCAP